MTVKARKLKFIKKNKHAQPQGQACETFPGCAETVFGQLLWRDGKHVVQSPIVVARQETYLTTAAFGPELHVVSQYKND